jgi:hypothetical protein
LPRREACPAADDRLQRIGLWLSVPGSHREGRLDPAAIDRWKARAPEVACVVGQGDLVLMRPLVLHASSAARVVGQRRVLHLEFAAADLPGNLEWHDRC